jgi:hypothetical protein
MVGSPSDASYNPIAINRKPSKLESKYMQGERRISAANRSISGEEEEMAALFIQKFFRGLKAR